MQSSKLGFSILAGTVVAVNLFVIVLIGYGLSEARDQRERQALTGIENVSRLVERTVSETTGTIDQVLRAVVDDLERQLLSWGDLEHVNVSAMLDERRDWLAGLADLWVIDSSGRIRFGRDIAPGTELNIADREHFVAQSRDPARGLVVSNPVLSRTLNQLIIVFCRRFNDPDGRFAGIVSAAVPVSVFNKLLAGIDLGPHGIMVLRDANGAIIVRHPQVAAPDHQLGAKVFSSDLAAAIVEGVQTRTYLTRQAADGVERMEVYRRLSAVPFHLVTGMATADYLGDWYRGVWKAVGVAGLFLTATVLAACMVWRAFAQSARASQRSRMLLRNASDGVHILDEQGRVVEVSDSFCRMLGYSHDEILGMRLAEFEAGYAPSELLGALGEALVKGDSTVVQTRHRRKDGALFDVEVSFCSVRLEERLVLYCSARDITERLRLEEDLRIAAVAFESREGMMVTDANGAIVRVNRAFTALTGYPAEEMVGQSPRILQSGRHDPEFYDRMWQDIRAEGAWQGEIWNRRRDGEVFPAGMTITAVHDSKRRVTHYDAVFSDISERIERESRIRDLAFFDPLTRLPNRRLLMDRLDRSIAAATRDGRQRALLFIDLDNFKTLNDTLGHEFGDLLLVQVAERLVASVRETDTVGRLGGDEFVVILERLGENEEEAAAQTEAVVEKMFAALGRPCRLGEQDYRASASIGVTLFGDPRSTAGELLRQADTAMYQAKSAGRNAMCFFAPELQTAVRTRASFEEELRDGIMEGQFVLFFQPQVRRGGVIGAEALLRWQHPRRGLVRPVDFLPLAEDSGLIVPLGSWVLHAACRQLASWSGRKGLGHLQLAINVSVTQFHHPGFLDDVLSALQTAGADPSRLTLEVTEKLLAGDAEEAIGKMMALKSYGVRFALDDFGTGYSSLAHLKRVPLDELKIDESFVRDLPADASDAKIARTIVALGRAMGLAVIAEGVETVRQRDFLAEIDCHAYQGDLFSPPLPSDQFTLLLAKAENELMA